eukprot:PhM_4_TR2524/c0_g1_i1/m.6610
MRQNNARKTGFGSKKTEPLKKKQPVSKEPNSVAVEYSLHMVEPIPASIKRPQDRALDTGFELLSEKRCHCVRCSADFRVEDNHLYACTGHSGVPTLDTIATAQNIAIGATLGAALGTGYGLAVGSWVAAKAALAATVHGASLASVQFAPSIAAGTSSMASGVSVGGALGGVSAGARSVVSQLGTYRWSCCGQDISSQHCSRSAMHLPGPRPKLDAPEKRDDDDSDTAAELKDGDDDAFDEHHYVGGAL